MRLTHLLAAAGVTGVAALAPAAPALATFPGHDGRIVFGVPSDQGVQLHTVRPNGHDLRQITDVEGDALQPDWSADGGPIRVLPAPPGSFEGQPSYTPDGRHVLFSHFEDEVEATWIMRLDGSDRHRITAGPGETTDPNASPDGRTFSFVGVPNHNWEIQQALFKSSLDGSRQLQLTPFDTEVAIKQDWAPDGSRIVFTGNADFVHQGESANIAT